MAAIAMIFLSRLSKTLRDYLTYKYGWGYMTPKSRGEQDIREELEHQLRKQTLTVQDAYDSNHFSNLIFNRTSPVWKRGSLALFCLTALFLAFDVRYEIDLSEEKISYSPYFSLATKNYRYEDVTHITRECTLGVSDDREHPYLSYSLHLPDARKVLLFSLQGKGETPHLDAIEKIIPKLQNVKFEPTKVDTAPALRLDPTEAECIRLIHQVHDAKTSKRIISLFDLVS